MTALEALHRWGLRRAGGVMKSPLPKGYRSGAGGLTPVDEDGDLALYVERTCGFLNLYPVLRWVFVEGRQLREWPSARERWRYRAFVRLLGIRLVCEPWRPPQRVEAECEADLLAELRAERSERGLSLRDGAFRKEK